MRTKTWKVGIPFLHLGPVVRFDAKVAHMDRGGSVKAREACWGLIAVSKATVVSHAHPPKN